MEREWKRQTRRRIHTEGPRLQVSESKRDTEVEVGHTVAAGKPESPQQNLPSAQRWRGRSSVQG